MDTAIPKIRAVHGALDFILPHLSLILSFPTNSPREKHRTKEPRIHDQALCGNGVHSVCPNYFFPLETIERWVLNSLVKGYFYTCSPLCIRI